MMTLQGIAEQRCCIFQPAIGCWALQTLVEIVIFSVFCAKKLLKSKKVGAKFCKKHVYLSLHKNVGRLFYSQKMSFFYI